MRPLLIDLGDPSLALSRPTLSHWKPASGSVTPTLWDAGAEGHQRISVPNGTLLVTPPVGLLSLSSHFCFEPRIGHPTVDTAMAADFWAGYLSGALGIVVGNPLDLIKVRLQAHNGATTAAPLKATGALTTGIAAPILGYGALNALLFVSYNRCEAALNEAFSVKESLVSTWLAGALGGLATWVVSAPTELIKCRAQASTTPLSSGTVAWRIWTEQGLRGLYYGGIVTALRDSIGYGFYFWSYELATSLWPVSGTDETSSFRHEAPKVLVCGGLAGIATWASVFPLDVIKTRVQTQAMGSAGEASPLIGQGHCQAREHKRVGAWRTARDAYRAQGVRVFFRGFGVCCVRAFIVNAVQWAAYEGIMRELGQAPT